MQQVADWAKPLIEQWYGVGEDHQYEFYRCKGCQQLITWKMIRRGGCPCDLGHQMVPVRSFTFWEKVKILCCPWLVNR